MTNLEKANQVRRHVLGTQSAHVGDLELGREDRAKLNQYLWTYMAM